MDFYELGQFFKNHINYCDIAIEDVLDELNLDYNDLEELFEGKWSIDEDLAFKLERLTDYPKEMWICPQLFYIN